MTGADWRDRGGFSQRRARAHAVGGGKTVVVAVIAAVFATAAGCAPRTRDNPKYCQDDKECPRFSSCDLGNTWMCRPTDGGATGGAGGGAGRGGTTGSGGAAGGGPVGTGGAAPVDGGNDASTDAPKTCPACAAPTPACDTTTGQCVGCKANSHCGGTTPVCNVGTQMCQPCADGAADVCKTMDATKPVCAPSGACVGCTTSTHCEMMAVNKVCAIAEGRCVACNEGGECLEGGKPICKADHTCVACAADAECLARNELTPACVGGHCVACGNDAHCTTATQPICVDTVCKRCATDAQCATKLGNNPGVCMAHTDGRCATDSEAIYVRPLPPPGCDDANSATGTATTPFCTPQRAVFAATEARKVIVLRKGAQALERWSYGGALNLTVVGQGGAIISTGTGVGITVTSGGVYLRDLGVTNMLDNGIVVSGTTTVLRMDRCLVTNNMGGGLAVNGAASYDIQNSVFADNAGTITPIAFGGVYLNSPGSALSRFWNNTVYNNRSVGVACAGPYPVRGLLVSGNAFAETTMCGTDASSSITVGTPVDPRFDPARPYHLTAASPCVDKGGATGDYVPPPTDIDGNPRPSGPASDCGAHELQK